MTWNERGTVIHISRPRGSTKGLRNKEVRTFELNKGLSPIFHIRCSPCKDAGCGREKRWQYRGTSMPLQTGCLSVVCMSHDPDSISVQKKKKTPTMASCSMCGSLWIGPGDSKQQAGSVALVWLKCFAKTRALVLLKRQMKERRAQARAKASLTPLSWFSQKKGVLLLSAQVNKRQKKGRVKAIKCYFAKWSLIGSFFPTFAGALWFLGLT